MYLKFGDPLFEQPEEFNHGCLFPGKEINKCKIFPEKRNNLAELNEVKST
jgi:hypothetical protein